MGEANEPKAERLRGRRPRPEVMTARPTKHVRAPRKVCDGASERNCSNTETSWPTLIDRRACAACATKRHGTRAWRAGAMRSKRVWRAGAAEREQDRVDRTIGTKFDAATLPRRFETAPAEPRRGRAEPEQTAIFLPFWPCEARVMRREEPVTHAAWHGRCYFVGRR